MKTRTALFAAAMGAAAQYLFDPERGRSRRVRLRDQIAGAARRRGRWLEREVEQQAEDLRNRVKGAVYEVTRPLRDQPTANDRELIDRVRSEVLGAEEFRRYTINVDAADGVVALRGQLDHPEEINDLKQRVAKVPGVVRVDSFLHLPGTPPPNKAEALEASAHQQQ